MNSVVRAVSGHHQSNGRNVQARGIVGVGVAKFDGNQLMAFQLERVALEFIRNPKPFWNLARESEIPESVDLFR